MAWQATTPGRPFYGANARMRQNRRLFSASFTLTLSLSAAGLATLAGCGEKGLRTYPVTGTVMVDGQPAEGAMLIFVPGEGSEEFLRQRPAGQTTADGKFQMTTFEANDGAPAGQYKVMIRWMGANPQAVSQPRDDRARGPADRLRGRYFNPETSGLTATVNEEATELPPFELKTK
jgi:hypothetical protein